MHERNVDHHREATAHFRKAYEEFVHIRHQFEKDAAAANVEQLVDTWYTVRECEELYEKLRKEHTLLKELIEKIVCAFWVKIGTGDSLKTSYCTATPDVRQGTKIPNKNHDPELYAKVMRHLGLSEEAIEHEVVRANWNGVMDYITKLVSEGRPLPPGIDETTLVTKYKLHLRHRAQPVSGDKSNTTKALLEEAKEALEPSLF